MSRANRLLVSTCYRRGDRTFAIKSLFHTTMSSKGSAIEPSLRRRLNVLERSQSLSGLKKKASDLPKILPVDMKHKSKDEQTPSSPTDDDSLSESSEDDKEHSADVPEDDEPMMSSTPPLRPTLHTRHLHRRSPQWDRSPMSPKSRAWYEFDLAVVVALVSPIGNWLTGGDHIKHLLLIALLIFYLHQVIESKQRPLDIPVSF